jgi:hypothetical protein
MTQTASVQATVPPTAQGTPAAAPAAPAAQQPPFTPRRVGATTDDDKHAGMAIVGIMLGIFTLGLIAYPVICLWVA